MGSAQKLGLKNKGFEGFIQECRGREGSDAVELPTFGILNSYPLKNFRDACVELEVGRGNVFSVL